MTNNTTLGRIFYNPMLLEKYFLEVCKLMSYGNSNVEDQHKSLTESPKLIRGSHCWSPNGWFCLHKPHIRPWFPLQPLNGNKKQSKIKKIFRRKKRKKDFLLIASVDFHPVWRLCWSQLSPLVSFSEWERQTWQIVFLLKRNPNPHTGYILF